MIQTKKDYQKRGKEIEYVDIKTSLNRKTKKARTLKHKINALLNKLGLITLLVLVAYSGVSYVVNNYAITSTKPADITDAYIDCVNLGKCEDLTEDSEAKVDIQEDESIKTSERIKGNSKLGELVVHKGVYLNSAILEAIDNKFNPADAKKLKTIMLAECAKDYKIDGVASYECKSTTVNKNPNGTYDCGYLQINQKTPCTAKSFDVAYQVESAYKKLNNLDGEVCGKWNCWSSYKFKDSKTIKTAYNFWNNK